MKAIVIGATGATGKPLVEALLLDNDYTEILVFVRRSTGIKHTKLREYIVDFTAISSYSNLVTGDILFSCMGTTLKDAGSKEAEWHIDYDIPLEFARIAKNNDVSSCAIVLAVNADANSKWFYSRMKGELEVEVRKLNFKQYIIFQPGILDRPQSKRVIECMGVSMIKGLNAVGLLRKYRPLPTSLLGYKLSIAPKLLDKGETVIRQEDIFTFAAH